MTMLELSYGIGEWHLHTSPIKKPDIILEVPWGKYDQETFALLEIAKTASLDKKDGSILEVIVREKSYKLFLKKQHENLRIVGFGIVTDNQPRWFLASVDFNATLEDIPKGIIGGVADDNCYETVVETLAKFRTLRKRWVGKIGLAHNITIGEGPLESWLHS